MGEWFAQNWPWVVLGLLLLTKLNRHSETKEKKKLKGAVQDAEDLVVTAVKILREEVPEERRDGALNKVSHAVYGKKEKNVYLGALADHFISVLEKDKPRDLTISPGEHPLDALANRAVKSESRKEKMRRGLKKAGAIALRVAKGVL